MKFKVKPSQKESWRYIAFKIISQFEFKEEDVINAITNSLLRFFGEREASKINFWLVFYEEEKKEGIVRCSHKFKNEMITTLTLITNVNKVKVNFVTLGTSGTIKKCREKYLNKYNKRFLI